MRYSVINMNQVIILKIFLIKNRDEMTLTSIWILFLSYKKSIWCLKPQDTQSGPFYNTGLSKKFFGGGSKMQGPSFQISENKKVLKGKWWYVVTLGPLFTHSRVWMTNGYKQTTNFWNQSRRSPPQKATKPAEMAPNASYNIT